jgi:hypothetical protein
MLFRHQPSGVLAISQLTHAWVSGQILQAWSEPLGKPLLLAAEQHDIGWMDWETAPSFDPNSGRPHLFRDIGAAEHAPMWAKGVERALDAWGAHVALLISRHGGVIYRRYTDRHRTQKADAEAARNFLDAQAPIEMRWAQALGLTRAALERETMLLAFVDTRSLALCGELKTPLTLQAPDRYGKVLEMQLVERPNRPFEFVLSPWPFGEDRIAVEGEARPLPVEGRFLSEHEMRAWFAAPQRTSFEAWLSSPSRE